MGLFAVLHYGSGGLETRDLAWGVASLGEDFVGFGAEDGGGTADAGGGVRKLSNHAEMIGHAHAGVVASHDETGLAYVGRRRGSRDGEVLDGADACVGQTA